METLVMIHNPRDYVGWDPEQRVSRTRRVADWHDYTRDLHRQGIVTHAWGSHGITDAVTPGPYTHLLIEVVRTTDLAGFTRVLEDDPLFEVSEYMTVPLVPLETQYEFDRTKFEDMRRRVVRVGDPINERMLAERRAVSKGAPAYVGGGERLPVANAPSDFDAHDTPESPLRVLLYGTNPEDYVNVWDDMAKLLHNEKAMWWHDYMSMQCGKGKVSHAWGSNDSTSALAANAKTRGTVAVFEAKDYDEFDGLYREDPLRNHSHFVSVVLRPIADQRDADLRRAAVLTA